MSFKEVQAEELQFNPFTRIGSDWMLITAGDKENFNTMTASWGGAGVLWGKNTATCYIRPQRYTKEFIDSNDTFTLSFFGPDYRNALNICGTCSGRDCSKVEKAGLTPCYLEGTVAFEEANLIFVCRKLYKDDMPPENFIAMENDAKWYPNKDYHVMYIAEILKVFAAD
ncbi:flavin reductase [Clostridium sp. AM58-1XD]|uniref:flavin reductase n=1 Tax=Clostridium sp. AM58-1XD TaxID=2292307 RepID=UPI000E4FC1A6|nr:flavin reductase [Clostridium sp. AM58-1XD]RGY96853.1 flavin reductase family protein [Clostridium sp. AM58-1XD]